MSVAATRVLALPAGQRPVDLTGWASWLRAHLDPGWRPTEWNAQHWLFTGDLDSPRTSSWKCSTRACPAAIATRGTRCRSCAKQFAASGLSEQEFAATFIPQVTRRLGVPPGPCAVVRDGVRCARVRHCRDLCMTHASRWHAYRAGHPEADQARWLASETVRPYGPLPDCAVPGCERDQAQRSTGLCTLHRDQWKAHPARHPSPDLAAWIGRQAPYLAMNQFSLAPAGPLLRLELLYGLQQRDARGGRIDPLAVRLAVRELCDRDSLVPDAAQLSAHARTMIASSNTAGLVREIAWTVGVGFDLSRGVEPADKHTWDLVAVGVSSAWSVTGRRRHAGSVDFNQLVQPWLRDLAWQWARVTRPNNTVLGRRLKACQIAATALAQRPGGGMDPRTLGFADMTAIVDAFRCLCGRDRSPMGNKHRRDLLGGFFAVLDFGRSAGLLDAMPASFTRHSSHRILVEDANEDDTGKAIPEYVIGQLDLHLDLLGRDFSYGVLAAEDVQAMFHTAYVVLRDTGRRPLEVCSLPLDCLETLDGDHNLVWDNHKGRRNRRRLPVIGHTARAIISWRERRSSLDVPARSSGYLFPAITDDAGYPHLNPANLSRAIRVWVTSIPAINSDAPASDGCPQPFDRMLIYPYAFRHSYAQRHADAGVPVDVLKDLMDHKSAQTTMGYYTVSLKRKREAVKRMNLHVVDRAGQPAPFVSATAYEARSVAVPFGNCTEPSNVKAGGQACPIRFQCAGCGFYRPDPSYLPAIEDHIRSLKADRETAQAIEADEFVIRNLTDQITAFTDAADRMRQHLHQLPQVERAEIEEASKILRRHRAAQGRTVLPLTVTSSTQPTS